MSLTLIAGIIFLVVFIIVSRFISENALKLLAEGEKAKLLDSFSSFRKYNQIPVVIIFALALIIDYLEPDYSIQIYFVLVVSFFIFLVISHVIISKKLNQLALSQEYRKKFNLSRTLYHLGFVICGVSIVYNLWVFG